MLAVEMDVKPRNMNFAKVEKKRGSINSEGVIIWINTVYILLLDLDISPE